MTIPRLELLPVSEVSRRDTSLVKIAYLAHQLPIRPLSPRSWVRQGLRLRIAEKRRDCDLAAEIIRHRHYLGRWPVPPKTLMLSCLASLPGGDPQDAAGLCTVALLPGQYHVLRALDVDPLSAWSLVRCWRADDLGPAVAPDLMPLILRRLVKGCLRSGLRPLGEELAQRKLGTLRAPPRLLLTYADPAMGHDGALYRSAGARFCGPGAGGKLLFSWALDPAISDGLARFEQAVSERPVNS